MFCFVFFPSHFIMLCKHCAVKINREKCFVHRFLIRHIAEVTSCS